MFNEWLERYPELTWLGIAIIVFIILAIIARILSRIVVRVFRPFSFARDILERIRDPIHLLIPLIGVQTVARSAPQDVWGTVLEWLEAEGVDAPVKLTADPASKVAAKDS